MTTLEELRRSPLFDGLTDEQLRRVIEEGSEVRVSRGELYAREGEPIEHLYVVLDGELRITKLVDGREMVINNYTPGVFFGEVPLLAGTPFLASGRALEDSRLFAIPEKVFRRMLTDHPTFGDTVLETMAQRVQILQSIAQERERLNSLGTLAAGLAHELNNPAAAARRASDELREAASKAQLRSLGHDERFSAVQRQVLAKHLRETDANGEVSLDPLARGDREDEIALWLEDRGVGEAWDLGPTLVAAGLEPGRLERLAEDFEDERALIGALEWLGATLELANLADEVGQCAARISELVKAIKDHTYMDRSSYAATDVREGLESTLTILGRKLKGATVTRDYEEGLPKIWAHAGELNQVWINLVDNAADAVEGRGRIGVSAYRDGNSVVVEVFDDGPGIPRELQARVFEPFFTTKQVGEATGLGLDIVRRIVASHGGEVALASEFRETRLVVRLPIERKSG